MENRYKDLLEKGNDQILALNVANQTLREILACEFKGKYNAGTRVLEIGCGHGHSALPILRKNPGLSMDLLDVNPKMIEECRERLGEYSNRVNFICDDALKYLEKCENYDFITSSWTIHNFLWEDKRKLFGAIHEKLKYNGLLLLMDKVYPDSENISQMLLEIQMRRFDRYLEIPLSTEINKHEMQDIQTAYRMEEKQTIEELKKIGFKNIEVIDRIERDVVLKAVK